MDKNMIIFHRGLYQKLKITVVRPVFIKPVIASAPEAREAISLNTKNYEIASSLILRSSQ